MGDLTPQIAQRLGSNVDAGAFVAGVAAESVADEARRYIASAKAPATLRAYRSDWAHFCTWCGTHDRGALPAEPETVALYLSDWSGWPGRPPCSGGCRPSPRPIRLPVTPLRLPTRWSGRCMPGSAARRARHPTVKAPAVTAELRAMVEHLPGDLRGVRDRHAAGRIRRLAPLRAGRP